VKRHSRKHQSAYTAQQRSRLSKQLIHFFLSSLSWSYVRIKHKKRKNYNTTFCFIRFIIDRSFSSFDTNGFVSEIRHNFNATLRRALHCKKLISKSSREGGGGAVPLIAAKQTSACKRHFQPIALCAPSLLPIARLYIPKTPNTHSRLYRAL
jgi:hypothetical protein